MLRFDSLPIEIWFNIIHFLPVKDVLSMERMSKRVHQHVQPAVKLKCTKHLQSPKYHSKERIARHMKLVMRLAKNNILPSVHQQLWALEAALQAKAIKSINTIKAHFNLIPAMHHICIIVMRETRVVNDEDGKFAAMFAAEFMQFLESKGVTLKHLEIKGKSVYDIIRMWLPVDSMASTQFFECAIQGDLEGCRRLARRGRRFDMNFYLWTDFAFKSRVTLEMVQFLIEQPGFNANVFSFSLAMNNDMMDILKLLLEQPGFDVNYGNIFFRAVMECQLEIVKLLLHQPGMDVNRSNHSGDTALFFAENVSIFELLLQHPDIQINHTNLYGKTALMRACQPKYSLDVLQLLLNHPGININHIDKNGSTALILAVKFKYTHAIELLLNQPGININHKDAKGYTAFMYAGESDSTDIKQLFMKHPEINVNQVIVEA